MDNRSPGPIPIKGERPKGTIVLDAPSWIPIEKIPRWVVLGSLGLLFIVLALGSLPFVFGWVDRETLAAPGYAGIFLINFFATAAWFVPVPPVAGHAAIVAGSQTLFRPGVVIAGSAGMTLAESTAYLAGMFGRGVADEQHAKLPPVVRRWSQPLVRGVQWMMSRYGFLTLLVLSGVPNPIFEFAGIAAGAMRFNFWRFLLAVGIGKTARVVLLVVASEALLRALHLD